MKLFGRHARDRTYDFEGRCEECGRPLDLMLECLSSRKVSLEAVRCPDHPDGAMVLWPQRDDIIDSRNVSETERLCPKCGHKLEMEWNTGEWMCIDCLIAEHKKGKGGRP